MKILLLANDAEHFRRFCEHLGGRDKLSMNILHGTVSQIASAGGLSLVDVDVYGARMTSIVIGTPLTMCYLQRANEIEVCFNESEVSLGSLNDRQISLNNQLPCTIEEIVEGEILSQVVLSFAQSRLRSLISTRSVRRLNLARGASVTAFIKSTEILLRAADEGDHVS